MGARRRWSRWSTSGRRSSVRAGEVEGGLGGEAHDAVRDRVFAGSLVEHRSARAAVNAEQVVDELLVREARDDENKAVLHLDVVVDGGAGG